MGPVKTQNILRSQPMSIDAKDLVLEPFTRQDCFEMFFWQESAALCFPLMCLEP
jgi:hypothetical protein